MVWAWQVGSSNGVQIQLYSTWIFYAVLIDLCAEVAVALRCSKLSANDIDGFALNRLTSGLKP